METISPRDHAEVVALFRAEIIGSLTHMSLCRGELVAELRKLSQRRFRPPGASATRTFSVPTLLRWYRKYKKKGLEGLQPKARSDKGAAQALSPEQKDLLCAIRRENPQASVPLILSTLIAEGRLQAGTISESAVRRLFVQAGLDRVTVKNVSEGKQRLRWQADRPGALWHGDVCHGAGIVVAGVTQPVRIHAFLDDASRYVVALEAMHQEREVDMLSLLVRAVRRHTPPDALYLDNGSTYRGSTLALACARMGTTLLHAKPYDAPARGKMERFWRTLRERCLSFTGALSSLHDLNVRLYAWLDEDYHRAPHAGLMGRAPQTVFLQSAPPEGQFDEKRLRDALTVHARRRVRGDSTVPMDGQDWETNLGFLARRLVTVSRCMVDPTDPPWIEHEGVRHVLHPVDPIRNARRRRAPVCLDTPHEARTPFDPPKVLLDKTLGRLRTPRNEDKS
jgi:putative transposase